jgi:hypothetical protein
MEILLEILLQYCRSKISSYSIAIESPIESHIFTVPYSSIIYTKSLSLSILYQLSFLKSSKRLYIFLASL